MEVTDHKQRLTIEYHCLVLRYSHLRIRKPNAVEKLTTSIEQYGQLVPVVVVPEMKDKWVLIDGHLRVKAARRLGRDTIEAEIWPYDISEALLMVLKNHSARALEVFEEALFLHELHTQFGISQHLLSERVGRDKSWVSRRLSLVEFLPNSILTALLKGKISLWTATRVLIPLARANVLHAERLLKYLLKNGHTTREMGLFHEHYQKSNRIERGKMINEPGLFFKAQRFLRHERGPEDKWRIQCGALHTLLSGLMGLVPCIFYERQTPEEYKRFMADLNRANTKFDELRETIQRIRDNAPPGLEANHCRIA